MSGRKRQSCEVRAWAVSHGTDENGVIAAMVSIAPIQTLDVHPKDRVPGGPEQMFSCSGQAFRSGGAYRVPTELRHFLERLNPGVVTQMRLRLILDADPNDNGA